MGFIGGLFQSDLYGIEWDFNGICSMGFKKQIDSYRWVKADEFLP